MLVCDEFLAKTSRIRAILGYEVIVQVLGI